MDKFERVYAALRGETVDRPPVALWRHFPESDQTADELARSVLAWQAAFDWDLIKITPASGYAYEDWGARFVYRPNDEGTRTVLERPIRSLDDWSQIRPLDVLAGVLGREVHATRLIAEQLAGRAPCLQTVFSPTTTVSNLAGRDRFLADLRERPDVVRQALEATTETTVALARAFLEAGANGLFFATQLAARSYLSEDEYRTVGEPFDRAVLNAVRGQTDFLLLHIHGEDIYFDLLAGYPVDAINWHDRRTPPTLPEGQRRFHACTVGGLDADVLLHGRPEEVSGQVRAAVHETQGRHVIDTAGCVALITTPEANLRAVREAVENPG
jgi:uroporphyrinogen decarboxylase